MKYFYVKNLFTMFKYYGMHFYSHWDYFRDKKYSVYNDRAL